MRKLKFIIPFICTQIIGISLFFVSPLFCSTSEWNYQPKGKLLNALEKYHVEGKERHRFYNELLDHYIWDIADEKIFVDDLENIEPTVVSMKGNDSRTVLVISISQMTEVYNSVFITLKGKLIYIGIITGDAKYKALKSLIIDGPSGYLVLIGNQTDSGTGVSSFEYEIYQILNKKIKILGSVPFEGDMCGWGALYNLEYNSEITVKENQVIQFKVKYKFEVGSVRGCDKYYPEDSSITKFDLFKDELIFSYPLRNPELNKNDKKSMLFKHRESAKPFLQYPIFIRNHFQKLKLMAKNGKNYQKCWLKQLLKEKEITEMKDSKYRFELLADLKKW